MALQVEQLDIEHSDNVRVGGGVGPAVVVLADLKKLFSGFAGEFDGEGGEFLGVGQGGTEEEDGGEQVVDRASPELLMLGVG